MYEFQFDTDEMRDQANRILGSLSYMGGRTKGMHSRCIAVAYSALRQVRIDNLTFFSKKKKTSYLSTELPASSAVSSSSGRKSRRSYCLTPDLWTILRMKADDAHYKDGAVVLEAGEMTQHLHIVGEGALLEGVIADVVSSEQSNVTVSFIYVMLKFDLTPLPLFYIGFVSFNY